MKSKILEYLKIPDNVSDKFPEDIREFVAIIDGSQEIYSQTQDSAKKEKLAELIVVWMRQLMEFLKTQKLGLYAETIVKVEEQALPKTKKPKPEPKPEPKAPEPTKPEPQKHEPPKTEPKAPEPPKPEPPKSPKPEEIPFKVGDKFLVVSEKRNVPYTIEEINIEKNNVVISGFNFSNDPRKGDFVLSDSINKWNSGEWIPYVKKERKKREPKPQPPKPQPRKPEPKAPEPPKQQPPKPQPPKPQSPKPEPPKKVKKPKYTKEELKEAIAFLEDFDDSSSKKELSKLKAMYKEYYS